MQPVSKEPYKEMPRLETSNFKELAQIVELTHQLFPSKEEPIKDIGTTLEKLINLTKKYGLQTFSTYLESVHSVYKDPNELKRILKENSKIALGIFRADTETKPNQASGLS